MTPTATAIIDPEHTLLRALFTRYHPAVHQQLHRELLRPAEDLLQDLRRLEGDSENVLANLEAAAQHWQVVTSEKYNDQQNANSSLAHALGIPMTALQGKVHRHLQSCIDEWAACIRDAEQYLTRMHIFSTRQERQLHGLLPSELDKDERKQWLFMLVPLLRDLYEDQHRRWSAWTAMHRTLNMDTLAGVHERWQRVGSQTETESSLAFSQVRRLLDELKLSMDV